MICRLRKLAPSVALVLAASIVTGCGIFGDDEGEAYRSPLSDYLGFDRLDLNYSLQTDIDKRITEAENERQQAIADCMTDRGFDYEIRTSTARGADGDVDPNSRSYASTYGFGITTMAFSRSQVGQHLLGYPDPVAPPEDPIVAVPDTLDAEQHSDYLEALTGEPGSVDGTAAADFLAGSSHSGGCLAQSHGQLGRQGDFYEEFGDDLQVLHQAILDDARAVEHHLAVEECVTAEGIEYTRPADLYQRWAADLREIHDTLAQRPDDGTGSGENSRLLPDLSAQAKAELLAIQGEETTLAVAVYDCGGSPKEISDLYVEIAARHEEEFIDEHQDRLDAFNAEGPK